MRSTMMLSVLLLAATAVPPSRQAQAADAPTTAEVLEKLHRSNQHEIEMGRVAQGRARSAALKSFAQTLIDDHRAADVKLMEVARAERIELPATAMPSGDLDIDGPDFDHRFAQSMLEDHKKDVKEVTEARKRTKDPALKQLLSDLVPTLRKHRDTAQKLVDGTSK